MATGDFSRFIAAQAAKGQNIAMPAGLPLALMLMAQAIGFQVRNCRLLARCFAGNDNRVRTGAADEIFDLILQIARPKSG